MTIDSATLAEHATAALSVLATPGTTIPDAEAHVPNKPGLYAISGSASTWKILGLGPPPDERPLYVGKAEDSLTSRDLRTHFSTGRTGSSTLRRSLAGLLASQLALRGQPRNPAKPGRFANYGLEPDGDQRLTDWMLEHLRISVWPSPTTTNLDKVETAVLRELLPPLNLAKIRTSWKPTIDASRRALAAEARSWRPDT